MNQSASEAIKLPSWPKNKPLTVISKFGNKKKISEIIHKYKPEAIFNVAAETHVDRSIDSPIKFFFKIKKFIIFRKFISNKNCAKICH